MCWKSWCNCFIFLSYSERCAYFSISISFIVTSYDMLFQYKHVFQVQKFSYKILEQIDFKNELYLSHFLMLQLIVYLILDKMKFRRAQIHLNIIKLMESCKSWRRKKYLPSSNTYFGATWVKINKTDGKNSSVGKKNDRRNNA